MVAYSVSVAPLARVSDSSVVKSAVSTDTLAVPLTPFAAVAVIVVTPGPVPTTTPSRSTAAMRVSAELQVSGTMGGVELSAMETCATRRAGSSGMSATEAGSSRMAETGTGGPAEATGPGVDEVTVTWAVSRRPPATASISVVPVPWPVTEPSAVTVAMAVSEERNVMVALATIRPCGS